MNLDSSPRLRALVFLLTALSIASGCTSSRRVPGRSEGMNPGECSDGADNDGDGRFDCADSDCAPAPICSSDGSVVPDGGAPDAGPDANPDTGRRDASPPVDSSVDAATCGDVSGFYENVLGCDPIFPAGEVFEIVPTGPCTYTFTSPSLSGDASVSGSSIAINVTAPIPGMCFGTIDTAGIIRSDCLECSIELHRL